MMDNVVVLLSGLPVTVIGNGPVGVEAVVVIVSWLVQVGVHAPGLNAAVAPLGSPAAVNDTLCAAPEVRAAVSVVLPDAPWETVMLFVFVSA
jgi:hypothetical protein